MIKFKSLAGVLAVGLLAASIHGSCSSAASAAPAKLVPIVSAANGATPPQVGKPGKPAGKAKNVPGLKAMPPAPNGGGVQAFTTCGSPSDCHTYNQSAMATTAGTGLAGDFTVAKPNLGANGRMSLAEIAIRGQNSGNVAEIGWNVVPSLYGDSDPHLFVFYWVNGTPMGYNGGCWVDYAASSPDVGANINSAVGGALKQFRMYYDATTPTGGAWWGGYGGTWIGYFPSSCWSSAGQTFTSASAVQAFGEVASTVLETCADMGTGVQGFPWVVGGTAARISSLSASGIPTPPGTSMTFSGTDPASSAAEYSHGVPASSVRSFSYGGPGWNSAGTGVGSTGSC